MVNIETGPRTPRRNLFPLYRNKVRQRINGWILRSIELTYSSTRDKGDEATPLVAFLILSCAIDAISGFYAGRTDPKSKNVGAEYKQFVIKYMPMYDAELFYKGLRCDLTHNFVLGDNIVLTHAHPERHKKLDLNREIWNLKMFLMILNPPLSATLMTLRIH